MSRIAKREPLRRNEGMARSHRNSWRHVILVAAIIGPFLVADSTMIAADGDLDPTFGTGGKVLTDFNQSTDLARAVALQPDSKLIVAGTTYTDNDFSDEDFAIARYNADGTPCPNGPWIFKADYPFSADGVAVATDGTFAYAFGGHTFPGGTVHAEVNRYNPATNSWSPLASMTAGPDYLFHAEYGGNGNIYVMGGLGGANGTNLNRIYNIATNTWSSGAPVPVAVFDHGHAYYNGKIYVIGGFANDVASSAVYAYDVATNTWSAPLRRCRKPSSTWLAVRSTTRSTWLVVAAPGPTRISTSTISLPTLGRPERLWTLARISRQVPWWGKLWVIGGGNPLSASAKDVSSKGASSAPASLNNTQIYDPVTNTWSSGPRLNTARSFADAVTLNVGAGQMPIIVGGFNNTRRYDAGECRSQPSRVPIANTYCYARSDGNTNRNANTDAYCDPECNT